MIDLTSAPLLIKYLAYAILFLIGQSAAMWGLYWTLPYKNLTVWESYKMAMPFAWLDWFFMTFAINIGDKYNLVTPTQDTFVLIMVQFALILLINKFYLKQEIFRSDIVAFFIIILGLAVSFFHIVSKMWGIPIHPDKTNVDEGKTHAFTKAKAYREVNKK